VLLPVALGSFVLGLAVGSFLNVVIHRVPLGQSVVSPRSACPGCGTELAYRDNVPVLSWLLLRGRCRTCGMPISARYPVVELGTGLLFLAVAIKIGPHAALPAYLFWSAVLVAVSAIDLETRKIPRQIIFVGAGACGVLLVAAAAIDDDWFSLREAAMGGAIGFGVLGLLWFIAPRGMGYGDVRLAGLNGLLLGWLSLPHVGLGLFVAFLLGAVIGIALVATGVRSRKDAVPFGPFLALGALSAVFVGAPILRLYGL
jgi:leader peptidase (prepilin peptidase)/N-methyltransferase